MYRRRSLDFFNLKTINKNRERPTYTKIYSGSEILAHYTNCTPYLRNFCRYQVNMWHGWDGTCWWHQDGGDFIWLPWQRRSSRELVREVGQLNVTADYCTRNGCDRVTWSITTREKHKGLFKLTCFLSVIGVWLSNHRTKFPLGCNYWAIPLLRRRWFSVATVEVRTRMSEYSPWFYSETCL